MMTFLEMQEAVARHDQTAWQHPPGLQSIKALQNMLVENISGSFMLPKRLENEETVGPASWQARWCAEAPGALMEHALRLANYTERSLETCLLQSLDESERHHRSINTWMISVISLYDQEFATHDHEKALTKLVAMLVSEQLPLCDAVQCLERGEKLENGSARNVIQTACHVMRHAGIALLHRSNLDGQQFKLLTIKELEVALSTTFEEHLMKLKSKKPPR